MSFFFQKIKFIFGIVFLFLASNSLFAAFEYDSFLPQTVIHANRGQQPIAGVRVSKMAWNGGKLRYVDFELSATTPLEYLKNFKVYYSPYPALGTDAQELTVAPLVQNGRKFSISFNNNGPIPVLNSALFLTAEVLRETPLDVRFSGQCTRINIDGGETVLRPSKIGGARVYENIHRIIPYYRSQWITGWGNWTDDYLDIVTDIIYFHVSVTTNGNMGGTAEQFFEGLEKLKQAKIDKKSNLNIILGVAHCDGGMTETVADATKRTRLANEMVAFAVQHGFQGIDIDWEYPDNDGQWNNYALFLFELKTLAYEHELTVTGAVSPFGGGSPKGSVLNMFDYVNFMSYDAQGQHSTMATMTGDINWARSTAKIPDYKIVSGIPFYSNETRSGRDWDKQQGYGGIINAHPELTNDDNLFTHSDGQEHYFNGITLLKQKAEKIRAERIGGAMVWCYDGDLPLTHERSAARAFASVLTTVPYYAYVKPTQGVSQIVQDGKSWETAYVGDAGLRSALSFGAINVLMGAGTYTSSQTLSIPSNVYLRGGFDIDQDTLIPSKKQETVFNISINSGNAILLNGSATLEDVKVNGRLITGSGRAVEMQASSTVKGCVIEGVRSNVTAGAGIYVSGNNCKVLGSRIEDNQSTSSERGGILFFNSGLTATIDACSFINNQFQGASWAGAWAQGGAIFSPGSAESSFTITNSLFKNNRLSGTGDGAHGGAIAFDSGATRNRVINCTFIDNSAQTVSCIHNANIIQNCVFYNNVNTLWGDGLAGVKEYNAYPSATGTNNVNISGKTEAQLFENIIVNDYTPAKGSLLINLGTQSIWDSNSKDILGNPRAYSGTPIDIGAFERQAISYTVAVNQGSGSGAYEGGESVTITADPPTRDKMFSHWVTNNSGVVLANESPVTFSMPEVNFIVTPAYRWIKGEQDDPVLITNQADLMGRYDDNRYYKLANDFNLDASYTAPTFKGFFDGDNKIITLPAGVTMRSSLFGAPTNGMEFKNVIFKVDGTIAANSGSIGAFLSEGGDAVNAIVRNCTVYLNGRIQSSANVGGLVGDVWGNAQFKIYESTLYLSGTIHSTSSADGHGAGGVFGKLNSNPGRSCVKNCNVVIFKTGVISTGGGSARNRDLIGRYNQGDQGDNNVAKHSTCTVGDEGAVSTRFKFNNAATLVKWSGSLNIIASGTPPPSRLESESPFNYSGTTLSTNDFSPIGENVVNVTFVPPAVNGYQSPAFTLPCNITVEKVTPVFTPTPQVVFLQGESYDARPLLDSPLDRNNQPILGSWDWNSDQTLAVNGDKLATFTPQSGDYHIVSQTIKVIVVSKPYLSVRVTKPEYEAGETYQVIFSTPVIFPSDIDVKYTKDGVAESIVLASGQTQVIVSGVVPSTLTGANIVFALVEDDAYLIQAGAEMVNVVTLADVVPTTLRYVTELGAGDKKGRNWANAAPGTFIQPFLDMQGVDTVCLAVGTYISNVESGTQATISNAFTVPANKAVYGGFTQDGSRQNSVANPTILTKGTGVEFCRIINLKAGATLKGVIVQGGNLNGRSAVVTWAGGGVYAESGATLEDCVIKNNTISVSSTAWSMINLKGAGIYADNVFTMKNTVVEGNNATINCTSGGYAEVYGAGVYCNGPTTIEKCKVVSNIASTTISGNQSDEHSTTLGAGLYFANGNSSINRADVNSNSCITVLNGNAAGSRSRAKGGNVYITSSANVKISKMIVAKGSTSATGNSNQTIQSQGGGVFAEGVFEMNYSTIVLNQASKEGGGVYTSSNSSILKNSVLWKNTAPTSAQFYGDKTMLNHCAIQADDNQKAGNFIENATNSFYLHADNANANGPRFKNSLLSDVATSDDDIDPNYLLGERSILINRGDVITPVIQ